MSYRVLMLVPEGLTFEALTPEQQAAISSVFGQYVLPMYGTVPASGKVVCDAVAGDNFDPSSIATLGLPFELIGMWKDDGTIAIPLNEAEFMARLPDTKIYDESGSVVGSASPVLHEPHRWSGWPKLFGE